MSRAALAGLALSLCLAGASAESRSDFIKDWSREYRAGTTAPVDPDAGKRLAKAALGQTRERVTYDPRYFSIAYPNGDIPADKGVCTDVLIRAYRKLGIDLQEEVHMDMRTRFGVYPKIWGRKTPDTNIDHRRVPNLMVFFKRHGTVLPISDRAEDYAVGDVVAWDLGRGVTHIGIVAEAGAKPKIVHNIGYGPKFEAMLFDYKIIGRFRYPRPKRP